MIGSETDGRVVAFQQAIGRRGWRPARVIGYPAVAADLYEYRCAGLVRFESPGRTYEAREAVYRLGAESLAAEGGSPVAGPELEEALRDVGRIVSPRQSHLGLVEAMARVASHAPAGFMSDPDDIALACDKPRCQAQLAAAGVAVPMQLGPVRSYEELRESMAAQRVSRAFVKLRHGSAASGIVALETRGDREHAWTTAELVEAGSHSLLYNTRRTRRYRERATVRRLVDALCSHGAYAERWVPKATVNGLSCDLRVVVTHGEPTHWVVRAARSPFTNLHLGGMRFSAELLRARMSPLAWQGLVRTCRTVPKLFPGSAHFGLDVAVSHDLRRHDVLEVNAFGDYIRETGPGPTPHDAQLEALWS